METESLQKQVEIDFPSGTNGGFKPVISNKSQCKVESKESSLKQTSNVHFSTKSDNWATPKDIVILVKQVLGEIDLDPSSDGLNVPAKIHYTKGDDGLSKRWRGKVFLNPPYGASIGAWIEKLCLEYESGHVSEALALLPARTDTKWFRRIRKYRRCFFAGRLHFGDSLNAAPFPSMMVYLGMNPEWFTTVFRLKGDLYEMVCERLEVQK